MRHGSVKVTMDVYAQAQMPAKRKAQQKVVEMIRPEAKLDVAKVSILRQSRRLYGVSRSKRLERGR